MNLNEVNFIAAGMGGVLSGVMHAPMTGIFLIAEITGGYKLLVPLMIVSALACFTCRRLEPYNVYKRQLCKAGFPLAPNPDSAAAEALQLEGLVETDFAPLKEQDNLREMIRHVMSSRRNVFPVLDEKGSLAGLVTLDKLRPFLLDSQLYEMAIVYDVMAPPGPTLKKGDSLASAARLFEKSGLWNIPVEDEAGAYLGFVSKSGVFDKYREILRNKPELF
jgi:CIC family chloride channel protein